MAKTTYTKKFVTACQFLAVKYDKPLYEILMSETNYRNVYAELQADAMMWDSARGEWVDTRKALVPQPAPEDFPTARVRLMCDTVEATSISLYYVTECLKQCGCKVSEPSRIYSNDDGGGRVYFNVEVAL